MKINHLNFFSLTPTEDVVCRNWEDQTIIVSIVCLTYNQIQYLPHALHSFLLQETTFAFEIIINDDASTDNTKEFLKEVKYHYPKLVKININLDNFHAQGKKNLPPLLNIISGQYIAFCDGDDYWTAPNKLSLQISALLADPSCRLCFHSHIRTLDDDNILIGEVKPSPLKERYTLEDIVKHNGCLNQTATSIFTTDTFRKLPSWCWSAPYLDYFISCLAAKAMQDSDCAGAIYIDIPMSTYRRQVKGSWTRMPISNLLAQKDKLFEALDHLDYALDGTYKLAIRRIKSIRLYEYAKKSLDANKNWAALTLTVELLRMLQFSATLKIIYFAIFRKKLQQSLNTSRTK